MRVLLAGNGLEAKYQPALKKSSIIKNVLNGKIENEEDRNKYPSIYPYAIKNFAQKNNIDLKNETGNDKFSINDWLKIKSILNQEPNFKSIEDFYIEIEEAIYDNKNVDTLKKLFLAYLNNLSNEIQISQFENHEIWWNANGKLESIVVNEVREKLSNYDLIVTTNYTNFIERNLGKSNIPICHIHGKINDSDNEPLLGKIKQDQEDQSLLKVLKNLKNSLKDIDWKHINKSKLSLDIFGWSCINEHDLINIIMQTVLDYMFKDEDDLECRNAFFEDEYPNGNNQIELEDYKVKKKQEYGNTLNLNNNLDKLKSKKIEINYYYYDEKEDKKNFKIFLTNQGKWIENQMVTLNEIKRLGWKKRFKAYSLDLELRIKSYPEDEEIELSEIQFQNIKHFEIDAKEFGLPLSKEEKTYQSYQNNSIGGRVNKNASELY